MVILYLRVAVARGRGGKLQVRSLAPERPVLLYDNDCGVCTRFARLVYRFSKGWVDTVGLFTEKGVRMKSGFFRLGDRPDEMFWLLVGDTGYGGRSGLMPLAREMIRGRIL